MSICTLRRGSCSDNLRLKSFSVARWLWLKRMNYETCETVVLLFGRVMKFFNEHVLYALLAPLVFVCSTSSVVACTCFPSLPPNLRMAEELVLSDVIFQGRVLPTPGVPTTNWVWKPVFSVDKVWKGKIPGQIDIHNGFSCSEFFMPGQEYVVFARYQPSVGLRATGCGTPTRERVDAVWALSWLANDSSLTWLLLSLTRKRFTFLFLLFLVALLTLIWLKSSSRRPSNKT